MPDEFASSTPKPLRRVLIVDDTAEVRQDLRLLLQLTGEVQVVGEASNGAEAINQAEILRPDVVVMDLEMPILDGYTATSQIKAGCPACRVIALTVHDGEAERQRATHAGVDAFVVKGAPVHVLIQALLMNEERNLRT